MTKYAAIRAHDATEIAAWRVGDQIWREAGEIDRTTLNKAKTLLARSGLTLETTDYGWVVVLADSAALEATLKPVAKSAVAFTKGSLAFLLIVGLIGLVLWLVVSGVRWLWEHPLF